MNISQRLRTCAKHTGLDAVIELLQEAADEIDALRADADRYRWLRKSLPAGQGSLTVLLDDRCNGCFQRPVFMGSLDEAIDAAIAKDKS